MQTPLASPMIRRRATAAMLFLEMIVLFATSTHAQNDLQPVPVAQGFIADMAGVLPAEERARISALLQKLNQDRGSQLGVVIVDTTDPEAIEDFAQRVFVGWKLGRKNVDDGVLLVLAVKNSQRRMCIQVGYGLEGAITDAAAETTISLLPMLHI